MRVELFLRFREKGTNHKKIEIEKEQLTGYSFFIRKIILLSNSFDLKSHSPLEQSLFQTFHLRLLEFS